MIAINMKIKSRNNKMWLQLTRDNEIINFDPSSNVKFLTRYIHAHWDKLSNKSHIDGDLLIEKSHTVDKWIWSETVFLHLHIFNSMTLVMKNQFAF